MFQHVRARTNALRRFWAFLNDVDERPIAVRDDDSDIEIRWHDSDYLECVGCELEPDRVYIVDTEEDMAEHVRAHKQAGHQVPVTAIPNLLRP